MLTATLTSFLSTPTNRTTVLTLPFIQLEQHPHSTSLSTMANRLISFFQSVFGSSESSSQASKDTSVPQSQPSQASSLGASDPSSALLSPSSTSNVLSSSSSVRSSSSSQPPVSSGSASTSNTSASTETSLLKTKHYQKLAMGKVQFDPSTTQLSQTGVHVQDVRPYHRDPKLEERS